MRKTLLTLAAGLLCLSASAAENVPYSYTFDNADCLKTDVSGWSISAPKATATHRFRYADKSGGAPLYGGNAKSCVVSRNISSASEYETKNVWLISPAIQLEGGKTYNVTYKYAMSSQESCTVSIHCAKAADAETLKAAEAAYSGRTVVGTGYTEESDFNNILTCTVTPAETGEYYIGLWDNTERAANGYLCVTDFSVEVAAAGTAPGVPTGFTAVADANGALKVAIEVSAPTVDASGNDLTGKVNLELLRGDVVIKTWEGLDPGDLLRYTDNNAANGMNLYSVRAVNADGTSNAVSLQVKVGMEIPNALKSFSAVQTAPGKVKAVWEKPDADIKGTTIQDKSLIKVKVEVYEEGEATSTLVNTFENLEGDEATLDIDVAADAQKFYNFKAYAVTSGGESLETELKGVAVGTPTALPYRENFTNGEATQLFYLSNYEVYRSYWYFAETYIDPDFVGVAAFLTNGVGSKATMYSGLIAIPAGSNETLTFSYASSSSNASNELEVLISNGEEWISAETLPVTGSGFKEASIKLADYAGKNIQFGLRGITKSTFGSIYVKDIKIGKDTPSGIETIVTDEAEGEAVYYDLMGRRVANPATGTIYIKVVNGKATRVLYR